MQHTLPREQFSAVVASRVMDLACRLSLGGHAGGDDVFLTAATPAQFPEVVVTYCKPREQMWKCLVSLWIL